MSLPKGVRFIFSLDGSEKIKSVDRLLEGKSYVASSDDNYIKLDYETISGVAFFDTTLTKSVINNNSPATSGFSSPAFQPFSNGVSNYSREGILSPESNSSSNIKLSNVPRNEQSTASKGSNNKLSLILKPSHNTKNTSLSTNTARRSMGVSINGNNNISTLKTTSTAHSSSSSTTVTPSHPGDVSTSVAPSSVPCNRITGKTLGPSSSSSSSGKKRIPCQNLLQSKSRPVNRNNINRINGSSSSHVSSTVSASKTTRGLLRPSLDVDATKTTGNNKSANNDIKGLSSSQRNHQQDKNVRKNEAASSGGQNKKKTPEEDCILGDKKEDMDEKEGVQWKKDDPSSCLSKTGKNLLLSSMKNEDYRDLASIPAKDSFYPPSCVTTSASADYSLLFPREVVSQYEIGLIIGDGNFAVVHECMHKESKEHFALKIIDKTKCKGREFMIDNEVSLLRKIHHPNVIQLLVDFDFDNELYLVTELVTVRMTSSYRVFCTFLSTLSLNENKLIFCEMTVHQQK